MFDNEHTQDSQVTAFLSLDPEITAKFMEKYPVTYIPDLTIFARTFEPPVIESTFTTKIPTFTSIPMPTFPSLHSNYAGNIDLNTLPLHRNEFLEILDVRHQPRAEAANNLETKNLDPELELQQPAAPPIHRSTNLLMRELQQQRNVQTPKWPVLLTEINNSLHHPNPNNDPTKAWILPGFSFHVARQAKAIDTDKDEEVIGLKSLGY